MLVGLFSFVASFKLTDLDLWFTLLYLFVFVVEWFLENNEISDPILLTFFVYMLFHVTPHVTERLSVKSKAYLDLMLSELLGHF